MTLSVLVLLALTGLILFEHAYRFARLRSHARGVVAVVFGVGVLAATAVYIWPALTDTALEVARAELIDRKARINGLDAEKARLAVEVEQSRRALAASESRHAETVAREARQLADLARDVAQVRRSLTTGPNALVADAPAATAALPLDRLRADVLALATLRVAPLLPPAAAVQRPAERPLDTLKGQMAARMTTPNYDIEVYPDRELIRGRAGAYYVVDLKNAASGVRFFFDGGKYTLARSSQEFRAALNSFVGEVLSKFEGKVDYALFVRGSADQKPYEGAFEPGAEFRRIPVVRALGGDKYGVEVSERRIGERVRNADLPDLRAAFLQKIVAETYPTKPPTILQGAVTAKADDKDRNVELILYVDW